MTIDHLRYSLIQNMIERALYIILTLHLLVSEGSTLKCYECGNPWNRNCPINSASVPVNDCKDSDFVHSHHTNYQCVVYYEREIRTNLTVVGRHCIHKNDDYCANLKRNCHKGYCVDECSVCSEDLCNSGMKMNVHFLTFLGAFVFILMYSTDGFWSRISM